MLRRFAYLRVGLVFILAFVGAKMLAVDVIEIPIWVSLTVIVAILLLSVLVSMYQAGKRGAAGAPEVESEA
jgi:tellurite resistance protein TerC